jgi:hypothetical protein
VVSPRYACVRACVGPETVWKPKRREISFYSCKKSHPDSSVYQLVAKSLYRLLLHRFIIHPTHVLHRYKKNSRISLNSDEGSSHDDFPMTLTMWSVATNPLQFSFVHPELSPKCSSMVIHPFNHSTMKTFLYHATLLHDEALRTKCPQGRIQGKVH